MIPNELIFNALAQDPFPEIHLELGQGVGISQMHVSRLQRNALAKLEVRLQEQISD